MSNEIKTLISRIHDWMWKHPDKKAWLLIGSKHEATSGDHYFEFRFYDEPHSISYKGNPHWSVFQDCTAENLRILLEELEKTEEK